jgi:diacylglycerol O-acyltransferase
VVTRLSGSGARALQTQSAGTPTHSVALVVMAPAEFLSHQLLHDVLAASLPQLARFRARLVNKPLGLGQPVWAEVDDYDPSPQIHRATLRAPGGQRELADFVTARMNTGAVENSDPLWEAWSIDGLHGGCWALAVKMSPALNDIDPGASSLWSRLLTTAPGSASTGNIPPEPGLGGAPSFAGLVADAMAELVENNITGANVIAEAISEIAHAAQGRLRRPTADATAAATSGPVPRTVFDKPLTRRRAVAFSSVSLADAKAVSKAFGGSITNVVLAACTLSLRDWLDAHDRVPDAPLLMRMPFELPSASSATRQSFAVGLLRIPVHLADPVQVLVNLHTATEQLSAAPEGETDSFADTLDSLIALLPPAAAQIGSRIFRRSGLRHQLKPICHGSVSYLSAERDSAYCAGAKVVAIHAVAPLTDGSGLTVGLTSHDDVLDVNVSACPDNVPAVDELASGMTRAMEVLVSSARKSPRGQGRSVVTDVTSHPLNQSRSASR